MKYCNLEETEEVPEPVHRTNELNIKTVSVKHLTFSSKVIPIFKKKNMTSEIDWKLSLNFITKSVEFIFYC